MADKKINPVEGVKLDTVKAVEDVKAETAKAVAEVREQVKPAVEEVRKRVRKAAEATKKTAAKAPARARAAVEKAVTGESVPVVYVQYQGDEEKVEDLIAAARAAFSSEHPRTKVTDLRLYIKPEERAAYYVVNEKFAGRVNF